MVVVEMAIDLAGPTKMTIDTGNARCWRPRQRLDDDIRAFERLMQLIRDGVAPRDAWCSR